MSKTRSSQKKVSLSELNNHTINNKRQALKDLNKLNFNDLVYKNTAQKRFYETISKERPSGIKGDFVKKVSISPTMGPGININLDSFGA